MRATRLYVVAVIAVALVSAVPVGVGQGEQIVFSKLMPLNAEYENDGWYAHIGMIDTPFFRPTGPSLKLVLKISPALETKVYQMELECTACEAKAFSRDNVEVGLISYIRSDTWNFKDGPYGPYEYMMTLKATNIDMYLKIYLSIVDFGFSIGAGGHVADLEVLVYDTPSPSSQTTNVQPTTTVQTVTVVQATQQVIPGFPLESIIAGLATGMAVAVVLAIRRRR